MSKVTDLLAELDAEFGKKPKEKAKKDVSKTVTTQRNSTGGFSDLMHDSNMLAASFRDQPGWRPVERVTYIIHQECRCCNQSVSFIGNEFIRYYNSRLKASINTPELRSQDDAGFELPRTTDEFFQQVDQCVTCIHTEVLASQLTAAAFFPRKKPVQLELVKAA